MAKIDDLSEKYLELSSEIKELTKEKDIVKKEINKLFDKKFGEESEGEVRCSNGYRFTREARTSLSLNEDKLKMELPVGKWKKIIITKELVDEDKLKKALNSGDVSEDAVRKCMDKHTVFGVYQRKNKVEE